MTTQTATARAELLRQELTRFIEHVTQLMQPECIILFGSLATGQVDEGSDLDLVVVADTTLPFYERIKHVLHSVRPRVGMDVLGLYPSRMGADVPPAVVHPRRSPHKRANGLCTSRLNAG